EYPEAAAVDAEGHMRESRDSGCGDERQAEERERSLAVVAEHVGGDRVAVALARNHEQRGAVDQDSGPAEQCEHDEADAIEDGVDVEVAAQAAADAADHPVGPAPAQLLVCGCVFCHDARLPGAPLGVDPERPWFDPTIVRSWRKS